MRDLGSLGAYTDGIMDDIPYARELLAYAGKVLDRMPYARKFLGRAGHYAGKIRDISLETEEKAGMRMVFLGAPAVFFIGAYGGPLFFDQGSAGCNAALLYSSILSLGQTAAGVGLINHANNRRACNDMKDSASSLDNVGGPTA